MIVVDTSAWVEFLRCTGSPIDLTLGRLDSERAGLALTEVVVMELLTGTRAGREERDVERRLASLPVLPLRGVLDYETAAAFYPRLQEGRRDGS